MKLFVVLPAYNEAASLPALLERLAGFAARRTDPVHAILVDDGSSDSTSSLADPFTQRFPLAIIRHEHNRGLAEALRSGMTQALAAASNGDAVATMDADDSHPPDLLSAMAQKLQEGYDGVVASRYAPGGAEMGLAAHRKILSFVCSRLFSFLLPIPQIADYTSGYRLYRAEALKKLQKATGGNLFEENSFACSAEILLRLHRLGARFAEVPLQLRYDLKKSPSKMRVPETVLRYIGLVWRFRKQRGES